MNLLKALAFGLIIPAAIAVTSSNTVKSIDDVLGAKVSAQTQQKARAPPRYLVEKAIATYNKYKPQTSEDLQKCGNEFISIATNLGQYNPADFKLENNESFLIAEFLNDSGYYYKMQKNFNSALKYFNMSINLDSRSDSRKTTYYNIAATYLLIANQDITKQNDNSARDNILKAISILERAYTLYNDIKFQNTLEKTKLKYQQYISKL